MSPLETKGRGGSQAGNDGGPSLPELFLPRVVYWILVAVFCWEEQLTFEPVPPPSANRRRRPSSAPEKKAVSLPRPSSENLPRRFGNYLLTSALSEDALGHVYRAIALKDNGEFVRLRILDSLELPSQAVADTIRGNDWILNSLSSPWIAKGLRMGSVLGTPYMAWTEVHGWTLDVLLGGFRSDQGRFPPEHALLIAGHVCAALDFSHRTSLDSEPIRHGLVWPGFVSIGTDGDVRLAGFGIAPAVAPFLGKARLSSEIAPYVAPEQQQKVTIGEKADVYSVGAILLEMLTGRRLTGDFPRPQLRAEDGLSPEVGHLLRACLAPAERRSISVVALRQEIGNLLVSGGLPASSFGLALFLAERLGPESLRPSEAEAGAKGPGAAPQEKRAPDAVAPEEEVDKVLKNYWERAES